MTDKPPEQDDDKEADRRFKETLGRLVNTPHKPHKGKEGAATKRGSKKD